MHKYPLFSEYLVKSHFKKCAPTMFNTRNNDNNKKEFRSNFLVYTVRDSVARVELDGGEDSLTCRSSSSNWGSSISSWGSSIGGRCISINSWGSSIGGRSISSKSWSSSIGGRSIGSESWGSSICCRSISSSSICVVVSIGISRSLNLSGSIECLKEASLGSSNLKCVRNRKRSNSIVDWGNGRHSGIDRGNWKVVTSHTESKVISNIVDSVDSSLISIGVRSSDTTQGIATFLLGTVDVLVSISNISKFILSLELGRNRSSRNRSSRSNSSNNWSSSICGRGSSNSDGSRCSSVCSSIGGLVSSYNRGSSIGGSGDWGSSSNWSSSEWSSIESCDRCSVCKPSINI